MSDRKVCRVSPVGMGALAIGAWAIGRLAIGRFAVRKGLLAWLPIEDLSVGRSEVKELTVSGSRKLPAEVQYDEAQSR